MNLLNQVFGWIFFRVLQLWGWGLRVLPFQVKKGLAYLGGCFWFYVIGFRVRTVLLNLSFVFPRLKEESNVDFKKRIYSLARRNFQNYFLLLFECLEKTTWSYEVLQRKVSISGIEHLRKATEGGKGVYILTAHIGNWEVMLALSKIVQIPLSCIVRYVRNSFWDEVLKLSRTSFEVNLLSEKSSGLTAFKAFKKGHLVCFVLDQHTGEPHGVLARFMGLKAWSAKGLAILASRTGGAIIPTYSYRKRGVIHVVFEEALDVSDLGQCKDDEQILAHVQRSNDRMESWIRKHPEQYFWVHRRFKAQFDYKKATLPF
jgi:Kdo2-lipid IVA lauroyltransferase/acyltransferase